MAKAPAAPRKTLSETNLVRFGDARLAALLMEAASADPALKRRLRLELAAEAGAAHLALELDKRLNTLSTSRARISWRKRPDLMRELRMLRSLIVERLGEMEPRLALDRLVAWFDLHASLSLRAKDPKGELALLFDEASGDLTALASKVGPDIAAPILIEALTLRAAQWAAYVGRGVSSLSPELARRLLADLAPPGQTPGGKTGLLVRKIADQLDDFDAWLATLSAEDRRKAEVGSEIARRLAQAGRVAEAREALEAARGAPPVRKLWGGKAATAAPTPDAWHEAEIAVLDAEGREDDARDARWAQFERTLSPEILKSITDRLADFDDVEATDRAVAYARRYFDVTRGLRFLMASGALRDAAEVIEARRSELRGGYDDVPLWASRLSGRFPVAAVLLWRARAEALVRLGMVGSDEMASVLAEAEAFTVRAPDAAGLEPHDVFVRNLPRR